MQSQEEVERICYQAELDRAEKHTNQQEDELKEHHCAACMWSLPCHGIRRTPQLVCMATVEGRLINGTLVGYGGAVYAMPPDATAEGEECDLWEPWR